MTELLSTHHGKTAKLQKAKTTPFLYFPGKDMPNSLLNPKIFFGEFAGKVARFSLQANRRVLMCD